MLNQTQQLIGDQMSKEFRGLKMHAIVFTSPKKRKCMQL